MTISDLNIGVIALHLAWIKTSHPHPCLLPLKTLKQETFESSQELNPPCASPILLLIANLNINICDPTVLRQFLYDTHTSNEPKLFSNVNSLVSKTKYFVQNAAQRRASQQCSQPAGVPWSRDRCEPSQTQPIIGQDSPVCANQMLPERALKRALIEDDQHQTHIAANLV